MERGNLGFSLQLAGAPVHGVRGGREPMQGGGSTKLARLPHCVSWFWERTCGLAAALRVEEEAEVSRARRRKSPRKESLSFISTLHFAPNPQGPRL